VAIKIPDASTPLEWLHSKVVIDREKEAFTPACPKQAKP